MNDKETNKLRRRGSEKWETSVGGFSMGKKRLVVMIRYDLYRNVI